MKKNSNKRIIIGLGIVVLAVVVTVVLKASFAKPDNNKLKNQTINGLSFENASIEYKDNNSTFTVDVYNENKKTFKVKTIDIILENDLEEQVRLTENIDDLESDEGRKLIVTMTDYDLTKFNKVTYKLNK